MPDEDAASVEAAADIVFGLPSAQFTARRDELAARARAAGDRATAVAIKALRRPTAAAWLVNALARADDAPLREVLALGEQARAEAGGDPAQFARQRRAAVQTALRQARELGRKAGESAADAVLRDVESTLEAAIADQGAADAVRTGRLQRPLRSGGFDAVDLAGAVGGAGAGAPPGRPRLTVIRGGKAADADGRASEDDRTGAGGEAGAGGGDCAGGRAGGRAAGRRTQGPSRQEAAAEAAVAELTRAGDTARRAREDVEAIGREIEQLRARRAELERELVSAGEAHAAAVQRAARARRLAADAERRLAAAGRRAERARQQLDATRDPDR